MYYKGKSIVESPTHNRFVGVTTFQTSSKKLAWLNGMKARHEGEYNPVAGENDFRVYGKGSLSLKAMRAPKGRRMDREGDTGSLHQGRPGDLRR